MTCEVARTSGPAGVLNGSQQRDIPVDCIQGERDLDCILMMSENFGVALFPEVCRFLNFVVV